MLKIKTKYDERNSKKVRPNLVPQMSVFAFWPSVTLPPFDIIRVFDKVEGVEHESEVKTGTGSSFRRYFGEMPIVGFSWLSSTRLLLAAQGPYWGRWSISRGDISTFDSDHAKCG